MCRLPGRTLRPYPSFLVLYLLLLLREADWLLPSHLSPLVVLLAQLLQFHPATCLPCFLQVLLSVPAGPSRHYLPTGSCGPWRSGARLVDCGLGLGDRVASPLWGRLPTPVSRGLLLRSSPSPVLWGPAARVFESVPLTLCLEKVPPRPGLLGGVREREGLGRGTRASVSSHTDFPPAPLSNPLRPHLPYHLVPLSPERVWAPWQTLLTSGNAPPQTRSPSARWASPSPTGSSPVLMVTFSSVLSP